MKKRVVLCLFIAMSVLSLRAVPTSAASARRVLVVYPTGVNDSKQLADYYVQKRGIPATNVLGVSISMTSTGTYYIGEYQKFFGDLVRPIKAKLAQLGETNIDVILLVGAIPFEVRNAAQVAVSVDSTLMMLSSLDPTRISSIIRLLEPIRVTSIIRSTK
jgi:uncharacterized protein (TIGR03790 family)